MKRTIILSILFCQLLVCMARNVVTISGQNDWLFRLATGSEEADSLVRVGFYEPSFRASGFTHVHVPSNWAVLGFEEPVYRGFSDKSRTGSCQDDKASEGLYIKRFLLPDTFADKRVLLHFGGVWNSAEVWLNGQRVGRHDSGYTSFSMDVTGIAHEGENTLAVRVRQVYHGYKTDTYDDWTLGGIYRDVTVEAMPKLRWIDRVTAITPQGNMTVSYSMTPQVAVRFLPLVGTAVETQPKQWFGLGPEDAYPNKKSAPILGLYDARQWSGTRAARWIDTAMGRIVLTPSVGDYGYIDRDAPDSRWMRIVSHVQGRSEKGRLNDKRYQTASGSTFSGTFMIVNKQ